MVEEEGKRVINHQSRMSVYSGKDVDRAASILRNNSFSTSDEESELFFWALEVLSYWRACHAKPLESAFTFLSDGAKEIDSTAFVAKRPKRAASIVRKLELNPNMSLRNMHDIGGCRAVVGSKKRVYKVVRELKKRRRDLKVRDYIKEPKSSGYRCIHLVGKFGGGDSHDRKIELQVRSETQHSWATAVEIVDIFTQQAIKSNVGSPEWKNFFILASELFAYLEEIPFFETTDPSTIIKQLAIDFRNVGLPRAKKVPLDSAEKLVKSAEKLGVLRHFNAYSESLRIADEHISEKQAAGYALVTIDLKKSRVSIGIREEFAKAHEEYAKWEKDFAKDPNILVALISTDAVGGIKEAYPNYFADSEKFRIYLHIILSAYDIYSSPGLIRRFRRLLGRHSS